MERSVDYDTRARERVHSTTAMVPTVRGGHEEVVYLASWSGIYMYMLLITSIPEHGT